MNIAKKTPRIARFLLGGGIGVIFYYIAFLSLLTFVHYIIAGIVGFILNTSVNFLIQKFWTFENKDQQASKEQAVKYFILNGCIFLTNIGILLLGIEVIKLEKIITQIISTSFLTPISYFVTKKIFKNPEK